MNLTRFETTDGVELVIDTQTGEAFATQRGYARMSGRDQSTISRRCAKLDESNGFKNSEIDTGYGVKLVALIPADLVYEWLFDDKPVLAKAMGKAGATVYMHQLAGFNVSSTATVPTPQPEVTRLGSSVETTVAMLSPLKQLLSSVPKTLVDGFLLNQVQIYHPELKETINAAHSLLAATNSIPEVLLTPTAIGERLGITARMVNALLTENGYQVKNHGKSKTEPAYLPTELGEPYSSNTLATGKGRDNTSYQHTKWQESIVEVLRGLM